MTSYTKKLLILAVVAGFLPDLVHADPLEKWNTFACTDTGLLRGSILGHAKVSVWCPACEDSSSTAQTTPVQSVNFVRTAGSCQLKLNGHVENPAKLWIYGGFSYWENVLQVVKEYGGSYDQQLLKVFPAFIEGPGDPSEADVRWSELLPNGTSLLAVDGKRLGVNFVNKTVMMNTPSVFVGKDLFWTDSTGAEMVPTRLGSTYDAFSECKYIAYQHGGMGMTTAECGQISVTKICKDGKFELLGEIANPKCISSDEWKIDSVAGVMTISQATKNKSGGISFLIDRNGIHPVVASKKKRRQ
ncbi:MAG: hypothetical protein IPN71_08500 [Fibrobacteres bacterium]|nr:hypothetical protein [Fibrobacterota bacterium]